jgi:hypothetical protein
VRIVSADQFKAAMQRVRDALEEGGWRTLEDAGSSPKGPAVLSAEDWDAARKSLGSGSKSLLFGTSTKVLDSIAHRFKQQAAGSVPSPQADQQSNEPADVRGWGFNVHEGGSYSIPTMSTRLKRALPEYADMEYDEEMVTIRIRQSELRPTSDIRTVLRMVAQGVEELAEEIERVETPAEPPSS